MVGRDSNSVIYHSRINPNIKRNFEVFSPLEWLAALSVHIPNKGQHMSRYYGYYSNKASGIRKKNGEGKTAALSIEASNLSSRECRLRWANLIQKIYEVNPLICPDCGGEMKIISFIQDFSVIIKILNHLGLVEECVHSPPGELSSPEITYGPICDDFPIWE